MIMFMTEPERSEGVGRRGVSYNKKLEKGVFPFNIEKGLENTCYDNICCGYICGTCMYILFLNYFRRISRK